MSLPSATYQELLARALAQSPDPERHAQILLRVLVNTYDELAEFKPYVGKKQAPALRLAGTEAESA